MILGATGRFGVCCPDARTDGRILERPTRSTPSRFPLEEDRGNRRNHEEVDTDMNVDKTLTCADCGQEFTFTASEQDFYAERGFTEPRRCGSCRAARKAQRNADGGGYSESQGAGSYGAGGSYSAGGYSSGGGYNRGGGGGGSRGPREMFPATCSSCGQETEVPFRPTSGKPVYCSACFAQRRA